MICSITVHISGGEVQLRVQHQRVFKTDKPVLKSTGEPHTEGKTFASQILSLGVLVLCFNISSRWSQWCVLFTRIKGITPNFILVVHFIFSSEDLQKMAFSPQ